MAKNIGVVQYSGTLGNTVGAKKSAGQKANTIRIKNASIANPKTLAQCLQRMQMRGAANLYTALSGILDHSFQGVQYGAPSHNYFMSIATQSALVASNTASGVCVKKGSKTPMPFQVPIAEGTAPALQYAIDNHKLVISCGQNVTAETSLLEALQAGNPEIRKGDQITFIGCVGVGITEDEELPTAKSVRYVINRLVLDDDTLPSEYDGMEGITFGVADANLTLTYAGGLLCAGAVIVSRPVISNTDASKSWERSNSMLFVSDGIGSLYVSEYHDECINTYRGISNSHVSSPWYLNQGTIEETN